MRKHMLTQPSQPKLSLKTFQCFVLTFGTPNRILHDQVKEFKNKLFHELMNCFGIKRCKTTPYHPTCHGMVEHLNSTVIHMFRSLSD